MSTNGSTDTNLSGPHSGSSIIPELDFVIKMKASPETVVLDFIPETPETSIASTSSSEVNDEVTEPMIHSLKTSAYIPLKSLLIKAFNYQISCLGCNKSFPCYFTPKGNKKYPSPAYYTHCIDECPSYRQQGLIRTCDHCNLKFLDKEAMGFHKNRCKISNRKRLIAQKPHWMPMSILLSIINYSKFDSQTACRGCEKTFPCYRKGTKVVHSLDYYIHCIEGCQVYQDKGWAKTCSTCNCKFLNSQALTQHKRSCFKSSIQ